MTTEIARPFQREFYDVLADVQGEVKDAIFDKVNGHLKNKYASYGAILDAVRPGLTKHKVYLSFNVDVAHDGTLLVVHGILARAGEAHGTKVLYPFNLGWTPQQVNAAITYGKKACVLQLLGITSAEEDAADDDGEDVSKSETATPDQIAEINALLKELRGDTNPGNFLAKFGKRTLAELTTSEAAHGIAGLKRARGSK